MSKLLNIALMVMMCSTIYAGGFYKWKDEKGVLHITDHPPVEASDIEVDTETRVNKVPMDVLPSNGVDNTKTTHAANNRSSIDDRITNIESDLRYLNSQKRMDKSMERDGLRREIAEKEEMLNDLYMVRDGVPQDQISLIKQKKDLKSQRARLEGEKASMQAEMMRLENDKRDAEREAQELERENRQMEMEKRQMEANRIFNWP
jgi:chromosome segregation ATPase